MSEITRNPTVNDGKGFYDNLGLCDSLIQDCNNLVKHIASGHYIWFCSTIVQMVQKLNNLKKGIKADTDSLKDKVEELKRQNAELFQQQTGIPVDRGDAHGEN